MSSKWTPLHEICTQLLGKLSHVVLTQYWTRPFGLSTALGLLLMLRLGDGENCHSLKTRIHYAKGVNFVNSGVIFIDLLHFSRATAQGNNDAHEEIKVLKMFPTSQVLHPPGQQSRGMGIVSLAVYSYTGQTTQFGWLAMHVWPTTTWLTEAINMTALERH